MIIASIYRLHGFRKEYNEMVKEAEEHNFLKNRFIEKGGRTVGDYSIENDDGAEKNGWMNGLNNGSNEKLEDNNDNSKIIRF